MFIMATIIKYSIIQPQLWETSWVALYLGRCYNAGRKAARGWRAVWAWLILNLGQLCHFGSIVAYSFFLETKGEGAGNVGTGHTTLAPRRGLQIDQGRNDFRSLTQTRPLHLQVGDGADTV